MQDRATWTVPLWPLGDHLDTLTFHPRRDPEAWPDAWAQLPDAWRAALLGAGVSPAEVLPPLMMARTVELKTLPADYRHLESHGRTPVGPVRLVSIAGDGEPLELGEGETVLAFEALAHGRGAWVPLELALWTPGLVGDPCVAVSPSLAAWVALGGSSAAEGFRRRLTTAALTTSGVVVHRVFAEKHPAGHLVDDPPKTRKARRP